MEISSAILTISAICNFVLGTLIFYKNRRELVNFLYGGIALGATIWCIGIYFFRLQPDAYLFWSKITYISAAMVGIFYLYFTFYFPTKTNIKLIWHVFFISFFVIILGLILGTNVILKNYIVVNSVYGLEFGGGYLFYNLYIFTFFGIGLLNLFIKHFKSSGISRVQIKYVLIGTFLSISISTFTNLILFNQKIFDYNWVGPSSLLFLVGFVGSAIVKLRLMNIKVILTEALIFIVGMILLLEMMTSESLEQIIYKTSIFLAFSCVGILLLKSVYKEIERRQEIEKIDKAKSEFISIASHQLRTPLTAIKGYISMIIEGTYGELLEKTRKPMNNVYESNERLIRLVNDLLNLSRLDAGKIQFSPALTSLEEMTASIVDEMKINAKNKGLYIKITKPAKPLPKIMADEDKVRQVVLNILDNAIKYTNKGGINIELKKLDSTEQIRVADTGAGMTQDEIDTLFQMFSRATAGAQLHTEGAGIGLYVARQFIEMHGGKIWAESEGKGKGSTFIIQLPIHLDPKLLKVKIKEISPSQKHFF